MADARFVELCARLAPRLRAVLLDAGNTLIHPDWETLARWCAEAGFPYRVEELLRSEYLARKAWDAYMAGQGPPHDEGYFGAILRNLGMNGPARAHVLERIRQAEQEGSWWLCVRPGTVEALQTLGELKLLRVVVSNSDGRVEQFLQRAGLRPFLDVVIDSTLVGVEKPDPRIFRIALDRAGVRADEAVHVGDLCTVDVAGARAAGIEGVVLDPLGLYDTCQAPRVASLSELSAELARWRRHAPDSQPAPTPAGA